jgi:predicted transcriptional regulator
MPRPATLDLSRRERQIMSALYRLGPATAAEVLAAIPKPPSYSAIRAHLRVLEEKGHVRHEDDGTRYVYQPTVPRERARRGALADMVHTFFDGSASQAVAALLDADPNISKAELDRLMQLIEQARAEGR